MMNGFALFRGLTSRTPATAIFARAMSTGTPAGGAQSALEVRMKFASNLNSMVANQGASVVGRSVPVASGGANRAYMRLNRILSDNGIRRELQLRRRYEKPKYKRQRLRQESHARRFKEEVKQKVHLIMRMKNWGM